MRGRTTMMRTQKKNNTLEGWNKARCVKCVGWTGYGKPQNPYCKGCLFIDLNKELVNKYIGFVPRVKYLWNKVMNHFM